MARGAKPKYEKPMALLGVRVHAQLEGRILELAAQRGVDRATILREVFTRGVATFDDTIA